ncbi:MauE/DoxX family redox-associated membrane protein [Nocardiopsis ansamitocini]|uniref:Methylamine utilisation protein MauE domain-containing protein n=1 Tax=Nocardiopsis ansamitocini TaxID=1670832 RepID=A0A9W6P8Z0_9ACTN|nr:MauE/DoxX family redox-associated membrane protein [Nocardiopsis ansamitocini]GLU49784.1 hypothetical protein Nans01_41350 [Nocardiopsis ansamitocini]
MIEILRETQFPILVAMLLLGAVAKAVDRSAQGPAAFLPVGVRRFFGLANAGIEAVLAVALVALGGLLGDLARGATALLFVLGLATLYQLRKRDPEMGCGCFGGLSTEPVGWRSLTRSGLLALAAGVTVGLPGTGAAAVTGFTAWHGLVLVAELAVFAALSPELGELVKRLRNPVPCELREVPLNRSIRRLRSSDAWADSRAFLTGTEPVDVWRHGCWRLVRFAGQRRERPVDVVFAVPLNGMRKEVRVTVTGTRADTEPAAPGEASAPVSRSQGTPTHSSRFV